MYESLLNLTNRMHDEADKLDDDSEKSMMEGQCDHHTAKRLRLYANELTLIVAEGMSEL